MKQIFTYPQVIALMIGIVESPIQRRKELGSSNFLTPNIICAMDSTSNHSADRRNEQPSDRFFDSHVSSDVPYWRTPEILNEWLSTLSSSSERAPQSFPQQHSRSHLYSAHNESDGAAVSGTPAFSTSELSHRESNESNSRPVSAVGSYMSSHPGIYVI